MSSLGLSPGPWLKRLKDPRGLDGRIVIGDSTYSANDLYRKLIVETRGESIAYLTDFLLDDAAMHRLTKILRHCDTIICEG